jgi:hypothetical protein
MSIVPAPPPSSPSPPPLSTEIGINLRGNHSSYPFPQQILLKIIKFYRKKLGVDTYGRNLKIISK